MKENIIALLSVILIAFLAAFAGSIVAVKNHYQRKIYVEAPEGLEYGYFEKGEFIPACRIAPGE